IDQPPTVPEVPTNKPKRATVPSPLARDDEGYLLLLPGEKGWADLPQERIIEKRLEARRGRMIGLISHMVPYMALSIMWIATGVLIPVFAWGAGFAAHAMSTWRTGKRSTERLYRDFDRYMAGDYGADWGDTVSRKTIQKKWRKQLKQFEARTGVYVHASVFAMINIMLWVIWADDFGFPWPIFPSMGWGIGLAAHAASVLLGKGTSKLNRASVEAELDMMRGLGSSAQLKRKNVEMEPVPEREPGAIRLTDDGELTNSMVEEFEDERRRARR
ncbi:MAG: 2TM domain-containing protein, partial [Chloroflexota bacterium]